MDIRDHIEADIQRAEETSAAIADGSFWSGSTFKPTPEEAEMIARDYAVLAGKLRAMLSRMDKRHRDEKQ